MKPIRRVAVLGAGTMGSRIAAHLANAQIPSLLLDVVPSATAARNGVEAALKGRPAAFFVPESASLITTGNFDDDLAKIADCDWIIEAVTENLAIKRALYDRVIAHRAPGAIVSTNTSGIPLAQIAEGYPGRISRALSRHALLQSAALSASGRNHPRAGHAPGHRLASSPISATAISAKASFPARTRRTSSPTASALSSAPRSSA